MANQTINNYIVTDVTYAVTGGTNVSAVHPTAILNITSLPGFTVTASDFSWINTSLANIATVVFTQGVSNTVVTCTVTFDNPFAMSNFNITRGLCIAGAAVRSKLSIDGKYQATGVATNMAIVANCPVPQLDTPYNMTGSTGDEEIIINKTYTASSGYAFRTDFNVLFTGEQMNVDNYSVVYTKTKDSSNNLTSVNIKVYYIFPDSNISGDKIEITVPVAFQVFVPIVKITNYRIDNSTVPYSGSLRVLRIYGAPTTTFTVASNNGTILDSGTVSNQGVVTYYATTPTLTMPAAGYFDINIAVPTVTSDATYAFTIAGGNLINPFPKDNPLYLYQKTDTSLTFAASGTGFAVVGSSLVKKYPANSEPSVGSDAYNIVANFSVQASNGNSLSIDDLPTTSAWSNIDVVENTSNGATSNTNTVTLDSATGIVNTMIMTGENIQSPIKYVVTNVNGNVITFSGGNLSLADESILQFSPTGGSLLDPAYSVTLNDSSTIADVAISGFVYKYGDENKTFTLDLTDVLTISGAANQCRSYNITGGGASGAFAKGGLLAYYDCITKKQRTVFPSAGEAAFAICALQSPAPTVKGDVVANVTSTVCNDGDDQACYQYSAVYNPVGIKNPARTVPVSFINCATNVLETINIKISSTATVFCANRLQPVFIDVTGTTTITRALDSGNCPT